VNSARPGLTCDPRAVATQDAGADPERGWTWDPSLYAGSARFYSTGRAAYPPAVADRLRTELQLDGQGRLLDVGCGPGSLTLLLAPLFADAVGVDADADMLAEADRLASEAGLQNVAWRHLRAEDLPADLTEIRVATFAQSFHWMDRPRVASVVRRMLVPGGALVHVSATTHEGVASDAVLPHPQPPRAALRQLVGRYLGDRRRAGRGVLASSTAGGEDAIYRSAGFVGPKRVEIEGRVLERTVDEVAASLYSLSSAAPHLFADAFDAFDAEVRQLLDQASPDGLFSEQLGAIALDVWR
jgi:SAM-dependent methyltransferase